MMNKRAQAALEFLMTYGWAILVVLAAIGALAYFGVLSPTNFVPERCVTSNAAVSCAGGKAIVSQDSVANSGNITFTMHVSAGYSSLNFTGAPTFTSSQVTLTTCSVSYNPTAGNISATTNPWALVLEDKDVTVRLTGCTGLANFEGKRITVDVALAPLNTQSNLPDPVTASITAKVQ